MTSELEQKFYDTFDIEPKWKDKRVKSIKTYYTEEQAQYLRKTTKNRNIQLCYPEITAEKLLEMICIWNYIMPYIDDCIIPVDYLGLKSVVLDKMIRYSEIKYEFDVDALKYQIQQLFKEEE